MEDSNIVQLISFYNSPLGAMTMACDDCGLTGLWFQGQKYFGSTLWEQSSCRERQQEGDSPIFSQTKRWLDIYFAGDIPDFSVPLHLIGSDFRKAVWSILCTIPYGTTITYGDIARKIATDRGLTRMSAQAVGGAVGHNPVSVIIPCHRVIGSDGSLTGYAGGLHLKRQLLQLEKIIG